MHPNPINRVWTIEWICCVGFVVFSWPDCVTLLLLIGLHSPPTARLVRLPVVVVIVVIMLQNDSSRRAKVEKWLLDGSHGNIFAESLIVLQFKKES
jgi:hypothetical protein